MISPFLKKIIFLSLLLCLHSAFATNHAVPINRIVAVVNDQVITQANLDEVIHALETGPTADGEKPKAADLHKQALDELIARDLQLQIAKLIPIVITEDDINAAIARVATQHQLTVAQLPAALAAQGMSMDKFKQNLKEQLIIQKFQQQQLAGSIVIKPKEIDALANKLAHQPKQAAQAQKQVLYHFVEMIIPMPAQPSKEDLAQAKQTFDEIAGLLNQNKSFDQASETALHKPATDLGWRSTAQIPAGFLQVAAKMKPGQIAPPARAPDGVHLIKLIETKTLDSTNDVNAQNQSITETHVRHILLKKDPLAPKATLERRLLSLRNDLLHGADFTTLAKQNSEDPGTIATGGDLGWVKPETLDPKFEAAMNALKVNEISMPVESQFGWHLIQVLGRKEISDPATALKLTAQQILFQQKMEHAIKQMISQLKSQAYIKIF